MIRRDYILRLIEEFAQALARLEALSRGREWNAAAELLDEAFLRLTGMGAQAVAKLSETELLAQLIRGEPTQVVREKTLMLTALLKKAGDLAATQGSREPRDLACSGDEQARACYLKGLHLLLEVLARQEISDFPEFVPTVESFVLALQDAPLPLESQARLMQHYERTGEFAKAEDALFAMLEAEPENPAIVDFGIAFYERLGAQSDQSLTAGNLPRAELDAGLMELRKRSS
jgi:hypothetical protein